MLHKILLGLTLCLAPAFAAEVDPIDEVLSRVRTETSECVSTLMVAPVRFAQSAPAAQVSMLHGMAEHWYRSSPQASQRNEYDWFVRRLHTFNGLPLMRLRPFARELHVVGVKIESAVHRFVRERAEYIGITRNFLERIARLPNADKPVDHAMRSILYAEASFLAFTQPIAAHVGPGLIVHRPSDEHKRNLARALHLMRMAVKEDELGLKLSRYVSYAAALLPILVADYVVSPPDARPSIEIDLIEILSDVQRGVAIMQRRFGATERRQLERLAEQLTILSDRNAALARQVPGLIDRVERLKIEFNASRGMH